MDFKVPFGKAISTSSHITHPTYGSKTHFSVVGWTKYGDNWVDFWWGFCSPCSKGDNGNYDSALKCGEKQINYQYTFIN